MRNDVTWVLVANSSQAKFYRLVKFPKIQEIDSLIHPESRLLEKDLIADSEPGRTFQRGGTTRHSYQAKHGPKELEADKFAKNVAEYLSAACVKGEFTRLYVFANQSFLGMLRLHIDDKTRKMLVAEVPKDMTECKISDVEHHIAEL